MTKCLFVFVGLWIVFIADTLAAEKFPPLQDSDRILVLAPHPDDEAIGASGILQEAVSRNLPAKVVYLTNGDSNEWAFIVYEKRLVFKQAGVIYLGEVRRKEAIAAMESLGLSASDLVFLGYPDAGTLNIFMQYWSAATIPYKSLLTRVRNVPYDDAFSVGAPYVGESILRDLKKIIWEFKPTRIVVSHPLDNNPDHRAFYLFLKVALWDLGQRIPTPEIYSYLIHESGWPTPRGFHPDLRLAPSDQHQNADLRWFDFDLTAEQVEKKREAISFYRSQIEYNPPYLFTFARKNELFSDYPPIIIKDNRDGKIDWQNSEEVQKIGVAPIEQENHIEPILDSLVYAREGGYLYIKLKARSWNDKLLGVNVSLLGYRRGLPFSYMPKYHLKVTFSKYVSVFEKGRRVFIKDMHVQRNGKEMTIKFPLSSMENPHFILSSAWSNLSKMTVDRTAWRVLLLE